MELWTTWTDGLAVCIALLGTQLGLSQAMAIIVLTLVARLAMMPVSLTAAYRAQKNREAMERVKPIIEKLRARFKDNPSELAARTLATYRANGIKFIDKVSMLNVGLQAGFGLGFFQALNRMTLNSKFLWIANLAKPDLPLTLLVGALMLITMALTPGTTADTPMVLIAIPVLVSVIAIAVMPSAIALYWGTSNAVSVVQTVALRYLIARQRRLRLSA